MDRNIAYVALFAALIAALGYVPPLNAIPGVPITAQSFGIMLSGAVLGARRGALAVLLFLLLVALGLPLLAGGRGGLGVFAGPTVGFLIGWPIAAFVTGLVTARLRAVPVGAAATIGALIGGVVVLYAAGAVGMAVKLDKTIPEALLLVTAFIPGDAIKAVLCGMVTAALAKARPDSVLSRA